MLDDTYNQNTSELQEDTAQDGEAREDCEVHDADLLRPSYYRPEFYLTPSDVVAQAIKTSLLRPSGWELDLDGFKYSFKWSNRSGNATVVLKPGDSTKPHTLYGPDGLDETLVHGWMQPERELIDRFSDLHVDIFDILMMKWLEESRGNAEHWSHIRVHDFISARGLKTANGSVRPKDIERHSKALVAILRLCIEMSSRYYLKGKRRKYETATVNRAEPVFVVAESKTGVAGDKASTLLAVRYRPGGWARYLMEPYAPQMVTLPSAVLRLDPYHERREKRLSRYLVQLLRMNRGQKKELAMRALLEGACIPISPSYREEPAKFICGIETALARIADRCDIITECLDKRDLPRKGKLREWLRLRWVVVPPP
ncbi:MAG: hypothetical protein ACYC2Y_00445 [Armatimonadota bacterium]